MGSEAYVDIREYLMERSTVGRIRPGGKGIIQWDSSTSSRGFSLGFYFYFDCSCCYLL